MNTSEPDGHHTGMIAVLTAAIDEVGVGQTLTLSNVTIDLEILQKCVQGLIEPVDVVISNENATIYVNEEGKLTGEPRGNAIATAIALAQRAIFPDDFVAGDVVFTGGLDDEGYSMGLSVDQVVALVALFYGSTTKET